MTGVMAVTLSFGVLAVSAGAVAATSCTPSNHGNWCNGTSPQDTGCAATSERAPGVAPAYIYNGSSQVGYVELRFSKACRTTWARVFYYPGGMGSKSYVSTGIYRSDSTSYSYFDGTCGYVCRDYLSPSTTVGSYGVQVYDGGYTSFAVGYICGSDSTCQTTYKMNFTGSY
jgi:hypothetical protein